MKRLIACVTLSCALILPNAEAQSDWKMWETTYSQMLQKNERRAVSMLEERYNASNNDYEKLYISSRLFEFMTLRGQPYFGRSANQNSAYSLLEQQFIAALNAEDKFEFDAAKRSYIQLLRQANQRADIDGKILFEYQLCRMLNSQGHYYQASPYCESLKTHIQDSSTSALPSHLALRVIANNLEFVGNYQAAFDTYQQYLSNIPSHVDPSGVYNDAGLLLKTLGNITLAKEYLTISIILRKKSGLELELAQSYHSLGEILLEAKEYSGAIEYFTQSQDILTHFQHNYGLTFALLGLGKAHIAIQEFGTGETYLLEALQSAKIQDNFQIQGEIYLALADSHIQQQRYNSARTFANDALSLADTIASERLMAQALKSLARISESMGDFEQALNYYQHYFSTELNKRTERHQVAYLALESARKEFSQQVELDRVLSENHALNEEINSANSLSHLYQVLIALLLGFIGLFFYQKRKEIRHVEVDALTGALNRAASIREIKLLPKIQRQENKYIVILMDLDDFKKINDNYGHPTGDRALRNVANIITRHIKPTDLFGRLGGEEFVIVMNGIDELEVVERVNKLHNAIGNTSFSAENKKKLYVTASLSYLATSKGLADFDELYSILDQALYQAKQNGKNRTIDAYNEPIYLSTTAYSIVNS